MVHFSESFSVFSNEDIHTKTLLSKIPPSRDAFQLNHSKTLLEITRVGGHHSQNEMEISLAAGKFVYS